MKRDDDLFQNILNAVEQGLPLNRAALLYGLTPQQLMEFEKDFAVELAKLDVQRELDLLRLHARARTNAANKGQSRPIEVALGWLDPRRYGNGAQVAGTPAGVVVDDL